MTNAQEIKTGLLFGSFNPIHIGHLALANFILEYAPLDEIWFVVSPQNPFKESNELIDEDKRLTMVELAIKPESRFKACNIEFSLPKPSYTINTLKKLQEAYPLNRFHIIMGGDNLLSINRWKNADEIISGFHILVYPRPGFKIQDIPQKGDIRILEAPLLDISSTFIRQGLSEGKKLRFLLPDAVFKFIEAEGLYQINPPDNRY